MKAWVRALGSPRLAVFGMVLLGIGSVLSYGNPETTPIWVLVVPLFFMSVVLLCAIITNPRIHRRKPLLLFHVSLLAVVVLAAYGRLAHFEAHVEMVAGKAFSQDELLRIKSGIFHSGDLDKVAFVQGNFTIAYSAGLVRGLTHSHVHIPSEEEESGWRSLVVGDDRPLILEGYRFYTTFNKGFAPLLTWTPAEGGEPISGTVHMPSYPLFEHKQDNRWTPPGAEEEIRFWLSLETGLDENNSWVLDGENATGVLVVSDQDKRIELNIGDEVKLSSGTLRYDRLLPWMGYKVFYDPTLFLLFITSSLSVVGLLLHFWQKFGMILPETEKLPNAKQKGKETLNVNRGES